MLSAASPLPLQMQVRCRRARMHQRETPSHALLLFLLLAVLFLSCVQVWAAARAALRPWRAGLRDCCDLDVVGAARSGCGDDVRDQGQRHSEEEGRAGAGSLEDGGEGKRGSLREAVRYVVLHEMVPVGHLSKLGGQVCLCYDHLKVWVQSILVNVSDVHIEHMWREAQQVRDPRACLCISCRCPCSCVCIFPAKNVARLLLPVFCK